MYGLYLEKFAAADEISRGDWTHPGGKLIEEGAEMLTDAELLSIIIAPGIKGRSAEQIADEIFLRFSSFRGMANQPLAKFLSIRGLGDAKIIKIAALFEIARRIVDDVFEQYEKGK